MKLEQLARAYNSNPSAGFQIHTSILGTGDKGYFPGIPILAQTFSPKHKKLALVYDTMNKHLPDPSIMIGIGMSGGVVTYKGEDEIVTPINDIITGIPYGIATDFDGTTIAIPLTAPMNTKTEAKGAITTIEAFLGKDESIQKAFMENQNFNIFSIRGLRAAIEQNFTYVGFDDLVETSSQQHGGDPFYLISITDKGMLQVLKMEKGGNKFVQQDLNKTNELSNQMQDILSTAITARRKSVLFERGLLQGVTSTGKFNLATPHPVKGITFDDKHRYPTYNHYLRTILETAYWGHNKTKDGKYIYTANPQIYVSPIMSKPTPLSGQEQADTTITLAVETESEVEETEQRDFTQEELEREMREFMGGNLSGYNAPQPLMDNAIEVNRENLEKLYNLAQQNKSGTSVTDMLEHLRRQGRKYLAEGYNPFQGCP